MLKPDQSSHSDQKFHQSPTGRRCGGVWREAAPSINNLRIAVTTGGVAIRDGILTRGKCDPITLAWQIGASGTVEFLGAGIADVRDGCGFGR